MPIILVTNDDGIQSEGLMALYRAMQEIADAYIVAPDREKSAVSHALTMHRPLRVEKVKERMYTVNGTPTDCVVVAVEKVLPEKPVMVISGINRGANLGDDITYSGTVSAAIEGTIFGIPSVAVSTPFTEEKEICFETAAGFSRRLVRFVLEGGLPPDTLLNVNVPDLPEAEIKGVKFTRQGKRVYDNAIHETFDPWGRKHFWIGGGTPSWEEGNDTDFSAVTSGYISITPIHLDLTNYEALAYLRENWRDLA
ncbi:MAG: 5'/3'-nucleotidase SurE [Nitrospirae bacterium]|nr:5'/3'-nucleotidase SurE [Nitrospirota bacterium]